MSTTCKGYLSMITVNTNKRDNFYLATILSIFLTKNLTTHKSVRLAQ